MAKDSDVPQPGPARLSKGAGPDEWLEQAKQCKYLPEADMKRLCEIVKECLMEGEHCNSCPFLFAYMLELLDSQIGGAVWRMLCMIANIPLLQSQTYNPFEHL